MPEVLWELGQLYRQLIDRFPVEAMPEPLKRELSPEFDPVQVVHSALTQQGLVRGADKMLPGVEFLHGVVTIGELKAHEKVIVQRAEAVKGAINMLNREVDPQLQGMMRQRD